MSKLQPIKIELFSLKKWERYAKNGVPMRLVNDRGFDCAIKAFNVGEDHKEMLVESRFKDDQGCGRYGASYYNTNGKAYNETLYIWTGCIDIEKGDLLVDYWSSATEDDSFFYFFFEGIMTLEKRIGYGEKWSIDCRGGQFSCCSAFCDLSKYSYRSPHNVRKATEEEVAQYWELLSQNGYERDETGIHYIPKVGEEYWTVEMEKGVAVAVYHDAPKIEEERPFGHKLCTKSRLRAKGNAEHINRNIRK